MNNLTFTGIIDGTYALVTQDDEIDYIAGAVSPLKMKSIKLTPKKAQDIDHANNKEVVNVTTSNSGDIEVILTIATKQDIAAITGDTWDNGVYISLINSKAPKVAIGFHAEEDGDLAASSKGWVYVCKFNKIDTEITTRTDNTTITNFTLTGNYTAPIIRDDAFDIMEEGTDNFDTALAAVAFLDDHRDGI